MGFNRTSVSSVSVGADSDGFSTEQIVRYTGYAIGATAVVGSVGIMTVVAPAQIALAAGVTAGCTVAANRMRDGKTIIPSFGGNNATDTVSA